MSAVIGVMPLFVYSSDDIVKGNGPSAGTQIENEELGRKKVWIMCCVAASQNLTTGMVVTIAEGTVPTATVAAAGSPAANTNKRLGVVACSVTASASQYVWVQLFGPSQVLATASTLPNVPLTIGATAGYVDDAISSLSAVISGIQVIASVASTGLISAFLDYPRWVAPSGALS